MLRSIAPPRQSSARRHRDEPPASVCARVTEILRGRRGISGDTALRLGQYFQVSPDFWMNLQKLYELDLARQQIGEELAAIMPRAGQGRRGR